MKKKKQEIKMPNRHCHKCNYAWHSESEMVKVSCPSCGFVVFYGDNFKNGKIEKIEAGAV